jgi:hypothetical protein
MKKLTYLFVLSKPSAHDIGNDGTSRPESVDQALERHGRQKTRPRQTPAGCVEVMMIMVGLCSRALAEGPPKMLPQRKTYRPSGYRAIQRLYLGRNLNRRRKRETRNQKTDLPRKFYPAILLSEYNPSLRGDIHDLLFMSILSHREGTVTSGG